MILEYLGVLDEGILDAKDEGLGKLEEELGELPIPTILDIINLNAGLRYTKEGLDMVPKRF